MAVTVKKCIVTYDGGWVITGEFVYIVYPFKRLVYFHGLHKHVMAARYHKGPCFIGGFKEFSIDKALVCLYNHNRKYGCDKRVLLGKLLESMHVW